MSISKLTYCLAATLVAWLLVIPSARAQLEHNEHDFTPFIDPFEFNPDFQFFAPAELGDFGNPPDPNTGWYGQYNRLYIYITRPELEQSATSGDFTWGHRYDMGYMNEEDHGWWFSYISIHGPNKYSIIDQPLINRFNEDDTTDDDDDVVPVFPQQDRNNILTGARDFLLHTSLNVADLHGFDFNKVWRMEPLHSGAILEPLVGFRYMHFVDRTRRDAYTRFDETGVGSPLPDIDSVIEQIDINSTNWTNHIVAGQLGFRISQARSRWLLSSDARMFAGQNFADYTEQFDRYQNLYDGVGDGSTVLAERWTRTSFRSNNEEFVYGVDVRAEAAFELTRDISFLVGAQVLHMAQGISRGENPNEQLTTPTFTSEDVTMVGASFGVTLNR